MLLALLFLIPIVIYWPGLYGDFFLDDYPHIVHNLAIQIDQLGFQTLWTAAHSTNSGPLGRPLALASFALNYFFTGLNPFYFKLTNLLIHAFTGIGVYFLLRRIATCIAPGVAPPPAFLAALLWSVHPLNISTVLYAVQRMTGLASLLVVWGLVAYCHGRRRMIEKSNGWNWVALGLALGATGMFAKETAVLMLGYLLVIEWLVFRFRMPTTNQTLMIKGGYLLAIGLPLCWVLITRVFAPGWIDSAYASRAFTLTERLLTEARVLWDYLYLTWLPNIQAMGLYHDGYQISRGLLMPPATLAALTAHVALMLTAIALRARWPLLLFAVAWFYVGHLAEATVLPLEIKFEHRNYLPMLGMLLLLVHGVNAVSARLENTRKFRLTVMTAVMLAFGGSSLVRVTQFGDYWGFAGMEATHYPESSRANQQAAISLIRLMTKTGQQAPEILAQAREYLRRSALNNPDSTAPLFTAVLFLPELTRQPPEVEFYDALSTRLRQALPDANINNYFIALLRQAEDGKLRLDATQAHHLFAQAEANPRIQSHIKADIIATRAAYAQSIEHDNAQARAIIDRALATAPLISGIYVPAVWIYQEAGMWQDAAILLEKLKTLDTVGIESHSIEWLSQRQKSK